MAIVDRSGLPVSVCVQSATPYEVTLSISTLLQMVDLDSPQNLIGNNAYDFDRVDAELRFNGRNSLLRIAGTEGIRPGWTSAEAIPTKVENREAVCLVAELPASGR